jgi:hypothetical protein
MHAQKTSRITKEITSSIVNLQQLLIPKFIQILLMLLQCIGK